MISFLQVGRRGCLVAKNSSRVVDCKRLALSGCRMTAPASRPRSPHAIFRRRLTEHTRHRSERPSATQQPIPPPGYSEGWMASVVVVRVLCAASIWHVVTEYGFELTLCDGPSMHPTIRSEGEMILVDRFTPRRFSPTGGSIIEYKAVDRIRQARELQAQHERSIRKGDIITWHQPVVSVAELATQKGAWRRLWKQLRSEIRVGDVVVVQHPERIGTICKRVLGLPGDAVIDPPHSVKQRAYNSSSSSLFVIPDGHIWIEGDNSMWSKDSRDYGPVPAAFIVGRVLLRVWPLRGNAIMERGGRPMPPSGAPFSGSTILPAGYDGEKIVRYSDLHNAMN